MSRLGGAGAVAPLVTDVPLSSVEVINMNNYVVFAGFLIIFFPVPLADSLVSFVCIVGRRK